MPREVWETRLMSSELPPPIDPVRSSRHPKPSSGRKDRNVSYSSPRSSPSDPDVWWPISRWGFLQKLAALILGVAVFAFIVGLASRSSDNDKSKPSNDTVELCESLRDPENRNLTRGDYERLFDLKDWELQRYVRVRCPDQYDRVD